MTSTTPLSPTPDETKLAAAVRGRAEAFETDGDDAGDAESVVVKGDRDRAEADLKASGARTSSSRVAERWAIRDGLEIVLQLGALSDRTV